MTVNYVIRAEVVDLRNDNPKQDDTFLVDTNIWYWLTYTRASQSGQPPVPYQSTDYPAYIAKAILKKAKLLRCGLSLIELASLIEKSEKDIFERTAGFSKGSLGLKVYRHNYLSERNNVVSEIQASWGQIKIMAAPIDLLLDEQTTEAILNKLGSQSIGGYDMPLLETIAKAGLIQIITDDGDFATVPDIQVFTANTNVIQRARSIGKLTMRNGP